jgi:hypothetical protein
MDRASLVRVSLERDSILGVSKPIPGGSVAA